MKKVRKAVIPVAGYGTRFLPYTKAVPNPLLPILNKPAIQVISEEVVESGIEEILFVVGYKKEIIESHFDSAPELEDVLESKGKFDFLKAVKKSAPYRLLKKRSFTSADVTVEET